jgi:hypothetical protein
MPENGRWDLTRRLKGYSSGLRAITVTAQMRSMHKKTKINLGQTHIVL